jgi:hypothetical protein
MQEFLAQDQFNTRNFKAEVPEGLLRELEEGNGTWQELAEKVRQGRFPMLAWIIERGEQYYRFFHLTFQEYLCAEYIFKEIEWRPELVGELIELVRGDGLRNVFRVACTWALHVFLDILCNPPRASPLSDCRVFVTRLAASAADAQRPSATLGSGARHSGACGRCVQSGPWGIVRRGPGGGP